MRERILEALDGKTLTTYQLADAIRETPTAVALEIKNINASPPWPIHAHVRWGTTYYSRSAKTDFDIGDLVAIVSRNFEPPKYGVVATITKSNQTVPVGQSIPNVYGVRLEGGYYLAHPATALVPVNGPPGPDAALVGTDAPKKPRDVILAAIQRARQAGESHAMLARWIMEDLHAAGFCVAPRSTAPAPAQDDIDDIYLDPDDGSVWRVIAAFWSWTLRVRNLETGDYRAFYKEGKWKRIWTKPKS